MKDLPTKQELTARKIVREIYITPRDEFAMAALAIPVYAMADANARAMWAYQVADAMIAARLLQ